MNIWIMAIIVGAAAGIFGGLFKKFTGINVSDWIGGIAVGLLVVLASKWP